ncbi:hypothetical protein SEA_KATNISS_80 [Mycobacterium phage Katniss]|uniref:Uncharacterized protein n=1 Tax=Mycobacterium phage ThreeOh3D2 TaxID=1089133 RepID=G8I8Z8_9CAUD|nr:hypothetical protein THREEOH3D2_80 [Mycobacterium phage ThreeOh3D2]QZD98457.1 hypothetical protein SEA_KATNISS_80 [Mycobacterium phage Katniss]
MREILSTGGLDNTDFYGIVVHMNANTTAAAKLELVKVEDHEGTGECPSCGRTGLRWICVMNDGSRAGVECAKKLLGYRPAPKHYNWVPEFTAVAEYVEAGQTFVLWQHNTSGQTRETRNGILVAVGGARAAWQRRGWIDLTIPT